MDMFCLVFVGYYFVIDVGVVEVWLVDVFGMLLEVFCDKVWQCVLLIIWCVFDQVIVQDQVSQLRVLGIEVGVYCDEEVLIWLLCGECVFGLFFVGVCDQYVCFGDCWCYDGDVSWQVLLFVVILLLLFGFGVMLLLLFFGVWCGCGCFFVWFGGIVVVLVLVLLWYQYCVVMLVVIVLLVCYVLCLLQLLLVVVLVSMVICLVGSVVQNDEDCFLFVGGQCMLIGCVQCSGDDYVVEVILQCDDYCQFSVVQFYVFCCGVFVGMVIDMLIDLCCIQLIDFMFDGQGQFIYSLCCCDGCVGGCGELEIYQVYLQCGDGGWVLVYGVISVLVVVEIISCLLLCYLEEVLW